MRFVSYAQEMEDLIIYVVLKDFVKGAGNYIDVGANDPVKFSVTKAFYDMGWSGINVEPLADMCEFLEAERPRDINLCVGAGAEEGELKLRVANMRSTFAEDVQSTMEENPDAYTIRRVLTLQEIFDRYCSSDTEIHFCKIDVEGFEREVLMGINFNFLRPWLMIVEATEPGTTTPCHEKWEDILLNNDYVFAFQNGINRYYVAKEKIFLKEKFVEIGNFIKMNRCFVANLKEVRV